MKERLKGWGPKKVWRWLKLSGWAVAFVLVFLSLAVPQEIVEKALGPLWLIVAVLSEVFAVLIWRETRYRLMVSKEDYGEDAQITDQCRQNNRVALVTVMLHAIFIGVGVLATFLPEGNFLRLAGGRDGILLGQYLLFILVASTYLDSLLIEMRIDEEDARKEES